MREAEAVLHAATHKELPERRRKKGPACQDDEAWDKSIMEASLERACAAEARHRIQMEIIKARGNGGCPERTLPVVSCGITRKHVHDGDVVTFWRWVRYAASREERSLLEALPPSPLCCGASACLDVSDKNMLRQLYS